MSRFDSDLREGLEVVLGTPVPALADESFLFFEQWLAERNLGLVPVANARNFEWGDARSPGKRFDQHVWLERVRLQQCGDVGHQSPLATGVAERTVNRPSPEQLFPADLHCATVEQPPHGKSGSRGTDWAAARAMERT